MNPIKIIVGVLLVFVGLTLIPHQLVGPHFSNMLPSGSAEIIVKLVLAFLVLNIAASYLFGTSIIDWFQSLSNK